jgi:hypothetical protein
MYVYFSGSHMNFISEAAILNLSLELTGYISNTTTRNTGRANALKLLFLVFF